MSLVNPYGLAAILCEWLCADLIKYSALILHVLNEQSVTKKALRITTHLASVTEHHY